MGDENNDPFYEWAEEPSDQDTNGIPEVLLPYAGRRFTKVDSVKLTFAEYWRMSPNLLTFLYVALLKTVGIRIPLATGNPYPDALVHINPLSLSPSAQAHMDPFYRACKELGFADGFWYTLPMLGDQEGYGAALRSADGEIAASILYGRTTTDGQTVEKIALGFHTRFDDGTLLATADLGEELEAPPNCKGLAMPFKPPRAVLERHRQRVATEHRGTIEQIASDGLSDFILRINKEEADFHLNRGVYQFMPRDEFEAMLEEKLAEHDQGATPQEDEHGHG